MATAGIQFPLAFGRYYLTQKVAMGGMAEVFRAKSIGAEGFEKVVAIKRILPHFSEDEGFVTMFKDEARVAAQLSHANVVQVFDFDEIDELFYIAMEYVEGPDLKRVLDQGAKTGKTLSIAQSVFILIEAGQGLHYAHTRVVDGNPLNIVHRDISPHNIMVSFNGEVKIMDFGIAKAASRSTKTRVGTVKGKCAYMSPEQARGKPLDGRSDLFALGVTLWEMLTGKRLFVGESDFETLNNVLKAEVPPPSELNPEIPKDLEAIVLKSLARDRDNRQGDVGVFVTELRRWFYSHVSDPEAVNLKGYMYELFADDIARLRNDVAAEQQMMEGIRSGTAGGRGGTASQRRAAGGTGSQPNARGSGDDEKTMALDTSVSAPADSDRTMALPDAMSRLGLAGGGGTMSTAGRTMSDVMAVQPKKSKAGLIAGLAVVLAAVVAGAAFVGMGGQQAKNPQVIAAVAPPAAKVKVHIKAAGATQIAVDDELVCTEGDCTWEGGEKGKTIKILAKSGERMKLVRQELTEAEMTVTIELPAAADKPVEPAPVAQLAAASPVVIVQIVPQNAQVTVNGQPVPLTGGNGKVPNVKLGDTIKVEAKADGYKTETKDFLVKNPQLETFEVKLEKEQKERVASATPPQVAGPGKLVVTAKPWAKVSTRGKDLGLTPVKADLPSGKHSLTLTKGSTTKTVSITIKAGQTTTTNVDMTAE